MFFHHLCRHASTSISRGTLGSQQVDARNAQINFASPTKRIDLGRCIMIHHNISSCNCGTAIQPPMHKQACMHNQARRKMGVTKLTSPTIDLRGVAMSCHAQRGMIQRSENSARAVIICIQPCRQCLSAVILQKRSNDTCQTRPKAPPSSLTKLVQSCLLTATRMLFLQLLEVRHCTVAATQGFTLDLRCGVP